MNELTLLDMMDLNRLEESSFPVSSSSFSSFDDILLDECLSLMFDREDETRERRDTRVWRKGKLVW